MHVEDNMVNVHVGAMNGLKNVDGHKDIDGQKQKQNQKSKIIFLLN